MKEVDEQALKTIHRFFNRKKYSQNTIERWLSVVREFFEFLEKNGRTVDDIGDLLNSEGRVVSKEQFGVKEYIDTKIEHQARYLDYLCKALKRAYFALDKHFPLTKDDLPKASSEPNRVIVSDDELRKMIATAQTMWLESVKEHPDDLSGLRNYCMVLINADCGARRYQISKLDVDFYDAEKNILFVPKAKGGRDTYRVLQKTTREVLLYYLEKRKKIDIKEKALFLMKHKNVRITPSQMTKEFRRVAKAAGIYKIGIGFHAPRRGKTKRLAETLREDEINDVMGWKKGSKMSHIYITLDQSEVQKKAADADTFFKKKQEDKTF